MMKTSNYYKLLAPILAAVVLCVAGASRFAAGQKAEAPAAAESNVPSDKDDDASAAAVAPNANSDESNSAPAASPPTDAPTADSDDGSDESAAGAAPTNATADAAAKTDNAAKKNSVPNGTQATDTESDWSGWVIAAIVAGLFIVPVVLGNYLAGALRMPDHGWKMSVILGSLLAASVVFAFGELRGGPDLVGGITLVYELADPTELVNPNATGPNRDDAKNEDKRSVDMDRLIDALVRRINPGGNKEVTVRKYGVDQIEIIIPKARKEELERIKSELTNLGELEFRITADPEFAKDRAIIRAAEALSPYQHEAEADGIRAKWVPYNVKEFGAVDEKRARLVKRIGKNRADQDVPEALVLVDKEKFAVTGQYLVRASVGSSSETGKPIVNFQFNSYGGKLFGRLTGANLPNKATDQYRNLAILLNRQLESAARINTKITTRGFIEGQFTKEDVESLVSVLNAGSLPFALNSSPISEETISPTLGAETIEKGKFAIGASLTLVLLFMLFYYRFAGIVACLALAANLVLILGLMVLVKAAFTLPGIAGLVLTIGMSVDANVLIFERIREEQARGAALRMAIRNGFGRATRTIVDANLTTLITGIVLFWIGTDQIKGFAVTMILGIVMSMYTAIFCSRVFFDIAERRRWITDLKMLHLIGKTHFDFIGKRTVALAISCLLIVIGLVATVSRGTGILNIDFTGGASVTMVLKEPMSQGDVHDLLANTDLGGRNLSVVERGGQQKEFTINARFEDKKTDDSTSADEKEPVEIVQDIIEETFGDQLETRDVQIAEPTPLDATAAHSPRRDLISLSPRERGAGAVASARSRVKLTAVSFLQENSDEPETPRQDPSPDGTTSLPTDADSPDGSDAEPDAADSATDIFTGGSSTTISSGEPVSFDTVRRWIEDMLNAYSPDREIAFSISNPRYVPGSAIPYEEWSVRLALPAGEAAPILNALESKLNASPLFPLSNRIGGRVAEKMQQLAGLSIVFSLVCIIGYIWLRFQHVVFGLAAVAALVHDILATLGMIAVSAYIVQYMGPVAAALQIEPFQISLPIIAAFLTIIGYSLNDTIVVFDRIREVRGKSPELTTEMVNTSINQTLSRTLLTSLTTLFVVVVLYSVGGAGIHGFAFSLVVGVLVGTYSSVFVASPVLLWMSAPRKKRNASA